MKYSANQKGFTLIELLVVISIIGMLSAVVIAAVNNARGSGREAAGLTFSGYNHRLLGANALVSYDFNELTPAGGNAIDSSGNSFAGSGVDCATAPFCRDPLDKPARIGSSLLLNGTSQALAYNPLNNLTPAPLSQMTASVWVKPTAITTFHSVLTVSRLSNDANNGRSLWIDVRPNNALHVQSSASTLDGCQGDYTGVINVGEWQNITFAVNGTTATVYLNGKVLGNLTGCNGFPFTPRAVFIGYYGLGGWFNGRIDDANVYQQALTAAEVQEVYAAGLPEHSIAQAE